MHCPFCAHPDTKVNDSRLAAEGAQIRRRRECLECGERFTTFETAELVMPLVVKSDQRRVPFDEAQAALRHAEVAREAAGVRASRSRKPSATSRASCAVSASAK